MKITDAKIRECFLICGSRNKVAVVLNCSKQRVARAVKGQKEHPPKKIFCKTCRCTIFLDPLYGCLACAAKRQQNRTRESF